MKNFAATLLAIAAVAVSVNAAPVDPEAHQHPERSTESDSIIRAIYAYGDKGQASSHDRDIIIKAITAYGAKDEARSQESDLIIRSILAYGDKDQVVEDKPEHAHHWWGKKI